MNVKDKEILQKREADFNAFLKDNRHLLDKYEEVILTAVFKLLNADYCESRIEDCQFFEGLTVRQIYYINRHYTKELAQELLQANLTSYERETIEQFGFELIDNYSHVPYVKVRMTKFIAKDKDNCITT
jgi:hypothetical protein